VPSSALIICLKKYRAKLRAVKDEIGTIQNKFDSNIIVKSRRLKN
jgi:hypothetical protein